MQNTSIEERMAKIEGAFNQVTERLNHIETQLRDKVDKWEVRIWFIIIMALLITILQKLW